MICAFPEPERTMRTRFCLFWEQRYVLCVYYIYVCVCVCDFCMFLHYIRFTSPNVRLQRHFTCIFMLVLSTYSGIGYRTYTSTRCPINCQIKKRPFGFPHKFTSFFILISVCIYLMLILVQCNCFNDITQLQS